MTQQRSTHQAAPPHVDTPWARPASDVLRQLGVSVEQGLSSVIAGRHLHQYGRNVLRRASRRSSWSILMSQFKSLIMALLAGAGILSFFTGDWMEGIAIVVVMLVTVIIGFVSELRAVKSMEALRRMSQVSARVRRNGEITALPAEQLVPGDIVLLESGDVVSADLRLLEANRLRVDQSTLTGESIPQSKTVDPVNDDTPVADRSSLVFNGTAVTNGSGMGVVVATGMQTELGRISRMVTEAGDEATPLERKLDHLAGRLLWFTLMLAAALALLGLIRGGDIYLVIKTTVALAVAAIPEGLPIVATVALARGVVRLGTRNALINRLSSVETLGATNVIFSDKTGTLTENRMTVSRIVFSDQHIEVSGTGYQLQGQFTRDSQPLAPSGHSLLQRALTVGVLCNNASLEEPDPDAGDGAEPRGHGDPLELALLVAGRKAGIRRNRLLRDLPEVREEPFDPQTRMMATFHQAGDRYRVAVKGAPEAVIPHCTRELTEEGSAGLDQDRANRWQERNQQLAEAGLRVLAVAETEVASSQDEPYRNLTLVGLVGMWDPPRAEIHQALAQCQQAGIRVIMVSGDQPGTALQVARHTGLAGEEAVAMEGRELEAASLEDDDDVRRILEIPVFARVDPRQKLDLIALHQAHGSVVAMTGDGVNDAPALQKADIGVAMGQRGTQVAQEAADVILKDDAFSTIATAVRWGRVIFDNIRKFIIFLLSGNVGEILAVAIALLAGLQLPLLPLQILFINLLLDVFPALALGIGPASGDVMRRPPRNREEPVLTRGSWIAIGGYGILIAAAVLITLWISGPVWGLPAQDSVTLTFLTLAFSRLAHVFTMREPGSRLLRNEITANPWVWGALVLCAGLLLVGTYVGPLAGVLQIRPPQAHGWLLVLGMTAMVFAVGQCSRVVMRRRLTSAFRGPATP